MLDSVEHPSDIQHMADKLESAFEWIYRERMADIPITNDIIGVHAIAFQHWEQCYLGVMITPWFMNLMILPQSAEDWSDKQEQANESYSFPSGRYSFLTGFEADIGKYQSCSLFSPMFEFADDEAAIETAEIIMKELMNNEHIEQGDINAEDVEKIWHGEEQKPDLETQLKEDVPVNAEKANRKMSRRQLLGLSTEDKNNEQP